MCHHYKIAAELKELLAAFKLPDSTGQLEFTLGNYYPTRSVPVIRQSDSGDRELLEMEWGLLPHWWKPTAKTKKRKSFQRRTFDARYETVGVKPTYREAFKRRRCLVPVTHFEEKKHYFSLPDNRLFAFAGLWEFWQRDDESVLSCTFLTTEPNAEVQSVGHHRMPILLRDESAYSLWMNPDIDSPASLTELLHPAEDGLLETHKIPT